MRKVPSDYKDTLPQVKGRAPIPQEQNRASIAASPSSPIWWWVTSDSRTKKGIANFVEFKEWLRKWHEKNNDHIACDTGQENYHAK